MEGEAKWTCKTCYKEPCWKEGIAEIKQFHNHQGYYQKACASSCSCMTSEDYQINLSERSVFKSVPGRCLISITPYYSALIILYNCRLSLVYEWLVTYYIHKMNVE